MILQNSAVLWGTLNFVNLIIFDSEDVVLIETEVFFYLNDVYFKRFFK